MWRQGWRTSIVRCPRPTTSERVHALHQSGQVLERAAGPGAEPPGVVDRERRPLPRDHAGCPASFSFGWVPPPAALPASVVGTTQASQPVLGLQLPAGK